MCSNNKREGVRNNLKGVLPIFSEKCKKMLKNMFIYTANYTASHKNTQNINIYNKTHAPKIHYRNSHCLKQNIFSKIRHSNKSALYADFYGTIYICIIIIAFFFWGRSAEEAVAHRSATTLGAAC